MIKNIKRAVIVGGIAVAAGAYFALTAPGAPTAQADVPCTARPSGSSGCEAHLGAQVRNDLNARYTYLPTVTDEQLGLVIADLCFQGELRPELRSFPVLAAMPVLQSVKGPRCG